MLEKMREISHPPRIMEMSQFPVATSSSSNKNLGIHFKKWWSNTLSEIANIVRGKNYTIEYTVEYCTVIIPPYSSPSKNIQHKQSGGSS